MALTKIMGDGLPQPFVELLQDDFEVLDWTDAAESATLKEAVGIIAYGHPTVDAALMDRMPNLKVVSNHGVGVDHIDVAAAEARNIPIGNTPGCLDASTADMTIALLMAAARNIVIGDHHARSPDFIHYDPSILIGHEVTGSTLGIIGMGRIGKEVARRANGFAMKVLYHNRNRDLEAEQELGVTYVPFDELLKASDFVTLNCPLTEETTGLISTAQFELMQPSAILVNMARGPVIDTDALVEALRSNKIAVAALDVTDPEPLPRDHPLLQMDNVVIAPHLGSASDRTRRRMMEMSIENLVAALAGNELPYRVRSN